MTQAISAHAIESSRVTDSEEDIVITDITRPPRSTRERQGYEKWKQKLRMELIREQYEAGQKNSAARKPVLLQLLDLNPKR